MSRYTTIVRVHRTPNKNRGLYAIILLYLQPGSRSQNTYNKTVAEQRNTYNSKRFPFAYINNIHYYYSCEVCVLYCMQFFTHGSHLSSAFPVSVQSAVSPSAVKWLCHGGGRVRLIFLTFTVILISKHFIRYILIKHIIMC